MRRKILIIDDDAVTLKILKKSLDESFEVATENSSHRFIEQMPMYDVELILLDLEMPAIGGIEVLKEILKNHRLRSVPVAFLVGVSNSKQTCELEGLGAAGVIVKTIPKDELIVKVNDLLDKTEEKTFEEPKILVLEGNVDKLRKMRDTLNSDIYEVRTAQTALDTIQLLKVYTPVALIVGTDLLGVKPQELYEEIYDIIRSKSIRTILLDKDYFDVELLDKVREVLN